VNKQDYLGDGLYVEFDGYGLKLWADREDTTHWVYLEPVVYEALLRFVNGLSKEKESGQ